MKCPQCGKAKTDTVLELKGRRYYVCENGHPSWPVRDIFEPKRTSARKGAGRRGKRR